ncbi:MAG: radical SAM protein [Thermodesulfobacteriota bacterium]|nr:radical SAM protein [Thermodesulfobacteriota bacterium]
MVDPPGKNRGLNTGLGYLSATLRESHDVNVLDLNNIEIGLCGDPNPDMPIDELEERIIDAVDDHKPELFGVSVKTFTANITKHIFRIAKQRKPDMFTVVGGPHITLDGVRFIEENRIDFGIQGEGEYTTLQLCNSLVEGRGLENIDGILYRQNGHIVKNSIRTRVLDLDALPFPYYKNFSSVLKNGCSLQEYPLLTSRGCPYKCSYCSMPRIMGSKWRCHSSSRVIKELQNASEQYGSRSFTVVDDNFTLDLDRVEDISNLLIKEKIDLPWNSQNGIRADRISASLAHKMRRSGCYYVWIGIESADEKVFNRINKGERLDDIRRGILHLKKAGIGVGGFFIVGLPYSTKETDLKSTDFVKEHGIDGWWFNFVPYPQTKAWNWVQNHGKLLRSNQGVLQFGTNSIDPVFETEEYTKESRKNTFNEIHIRLKLFDRLVDPSLKQGDKWKRLYRIVLPYGLRAVFSLLIFILKYNVKLILGKIKR